MSDDIRIAGKMPLSDDVLDLAEELIERRPNDFVSIMAVMFFIGYNTGKSAARKKKSHCRKQ